MKKILLALALTACGSDGSPAECSSKVYEMSLTWAPLMQGDCGQGGSSLYWIDAHNDNETGYKFDSTSDDACTGGIADDYASFECKGDTSDGYWTYTFSFDVKYEDGLTLTGTGKVKAESILHDYCEQNFDISGTIR